MAVDEVYVTGARNVVILNTAPLHLAPLYANASLGALAVNTYWEGEDSFPAPKKETAKQDHTSVSNIYKYQTPTEVLISK